MENEIAADKTTTGYVSADKILIRSDCFPGSDHIQGTISITGEITEKIIKSTNCKNCGAPLYGSKCGYCGTEY